MAQFNYNLQPVDFVGQYMRGKTFKQEMEEAKKKGKREDELYNLKMSAAREDALKKDARAISYYIDNGQTDMVAPYLAERVQMIGELGGDPSDTLEAFHMAQAGEFDKLNQLSKGMLARFGELEKGGSDRNKDNRTAQEKNFDKLLKLRESGKTDEAAEFERMVGLSENRNLSSFAEKELAKSQDKYFELVSVSDRMELLANDLEAAALGGGYGESFKEWFKKAIGSENEASEIRRKFRDLRASQVVKNLPPGAASDTDIQLALSGWPGDNANSETLASFLRGQAKLAKINAKFERFKAEYLSENKTTEGMLSAWDEAKEDYDLTNPKSRDAIKDQQQTPTSGFKVRRID